MPETTDPTSGDKAIPDIQVRPQGIVREFLEFLVHNKVWWMTPIILVILLMVVFILVAESSPVLPFIYTVI